MTEIKRSIKVEAPVDTVFGIASDYRKWPEFFVGLSDVRAVTTVSRESGARFVYRVKMLGLKVKVGTEFQDFRPNEGWTGRSIKGLEHRTRWSFIERDGGTEFTYIQTYAIPFYMGGRFIDTWLIRPAWIKTIEASLKNLKRLAESVAKGSSRQ